MSFGKNGYEALIASKGIPSYFSLWQYLKKYVLYHFDQAEMQRVGSSMCSVKDQTDVFPGHLHIFVCMWNVDHNSRHWKKDTGTGDEMFPQTPRYLIQRSHNQWGSESQNRKCHWTIWRPPDFSEKTQTEVVRAHHTIIWTSQDCPTGNSSKRETKRQKKRWEDNIKEWTGLEWNIILRKAMNSKEWRKLVVKSTVVPQRSRDYRIDKIRRKLIKTKVSSDCLLLTEK